MYCAHGDESLDFAEAAPICTGQDGLQIGPLLLIVVDEVLHLIRDQQFEGLPRQIDIEYFIVAHQPQMGLGDSWNGKTDKSHSELLCNSAVILHIICFPISP